MQDIQEFTIEKIEEELRSMDIPYEKKEAPASQASLAKAFEYEALPIVVDLKNVKTVDADTGIVVRNMDKSVDNAVYIFTVLRTGQAGFIVVIPGTVSRAPMIRKVSGDLTAAITGIDMPPLKPFDIVEIMTHTLTNTFMKTMMESCQIPEEYRPVFLRAYMPKFLANMSLYFTGATREDGKPMVYEEIINMEPMMVWRSIQKGAFGNEGGGAEDTGRDTAGETGEIKPEGKEED